MSITSSIIGSGDCPQQEFTDRERQLQESAPAPLDDIIGSGDPVTIMLATEGKP